MTTVVRNGEVPALGLGLGADPRLGVADDSKMSRVIRSVADCFQLQSDLDKVYAWSR